MDRYTKNALWYYWRRGDDEEVITDVENSNPKDDDMIEENEIAQILKIDTNIFHFEAPLCKAFKEFNFLSQINVDVLTKYILGFKTYEEYKDDWIYEWNNRIPWVDEKPWTGDGVWTQPTDNNDHECEPLRFKNSKLKEEALINKAILEESINVEEESSDDAWSDYSPIDEWKDYKHTTYIETDVSSNRNTYNNIDHNADKANQGWFDEHELIGDDDYDIGDLEDYLIRKDPLYYVNKE
ncbi:hypothetical protein Tco_0175648 [Tanacetum coccineum]